MEDGKIDVKKIEQVLEVICRIIYKLLKVLFQILAFVIEKYFGIILRLHLVSRLNNIV